MSELRKRIGYILKEIHILNDSVEKILKRNLNIVDVNAINKRIDDIAFNLEQSIELKDASNAFLNIPKFSTNDIPRKVKSYGLIFSQLGQKLIQNSEKEYRVKLVKQKCAVVEDILNTKL